MYSRFMSNQIGKRGENIFSTIISRNVDTKGFLLDPTFLGEKFPTVDFHVDLLKYKKKRAFFFASVKTTTQGYKSNDTKLNISIPKKELSRLKKLCVPVYIFGIDEVKEVGYVVSANNINTKKNLNGIPITHKIDLTNTNVINELWNEVKNYWDANSEIKNFKSKF